MHTAMATVLGAILWFSLYVNAHMMIAKPTPYGKSTLNNSPLSADGSDFPCKQRPGVYDVQGASNNLPLGSTQELSFLGSAVHGGGSCQLSITYDFPPSKTSTYKVIDSIEGGCPAGAAGNLPENPNGSGASTFKYTLPTGLPGGNATIVWTWFNKIGNREMYMNCAPVSLSGGSSKRAATNSFYQGLPDMFVANIGNGCKTQDSTDLAFPNPGSVVQKAGSGALTPPTGTCPAGGSNSTSGTSSASAAAGSGSSGGGSSGSGASGSGSSGSGSSGSSGSSGTNNGLYAPSGAAGTGASSAPSATSAAPASGGSPGSSAGASGSAPSGSAGSGSAGSGSGAASGGAASGGAPTGGSKASTGGASGGNGTASAGGSSSGTCNASSAGQSLCNGPNQIGTCDPSGNVVWIPVASGTTCSNGYMVAAAGAKRSYSRFARSHLRRGRRFT